MNDKQRLLAYSRGIANLVDYMFHDYGVPWENIAELLTSAGFDAEELADFDLSNLEDE